MASRIFAAIMLCGILLLVAGPSTADIGLRGSIGLDIAEPAFQAAAVPNPAPLPTAVTLVPGLPPIGIRTILVGLHLVGLCLGLGGVIVLDILLFKAILRGYFRAHNRSLVWILHKTMSCGLFVLWASGLAFLALYAHDNPQLLGNQKLWAKMAIVAVLTINGWFIHRVCLPQLVGEFDAPLFTAVSAPLRGAMLFGGSLSAVSWYSAAVLGTVREFNGAISAVAILLAWAAAVLAAYGLAQIGWWLLHRGGRRSRPNPVEAGLGASMPVGESPSGT